MSTSAFRALAFCPAAVIRHCSADIRPRERNMKCGFVLIKVRCLLTIHTTDKKKPKCLTRFSCPIFFKNEDTTLCRLFFLFPFLFDSDRRYEFFKVFQPDGSRRMGAQEQFFDLIDVVCRRRRYQLLLERCFRIALRDGSSLYYFHFETEISERVRCTVRLVFFFLRLNGPVKEPVQLTLLFLISNLDCTPLRIMMVLCNITVVSSELSTKTKREQMVFN